MSEQLSIKEYKNQVKAKLDEFREWHDLDHFWILRAEEVINNIKTEEEGEQALSIWTDMCMLAFEMKMKSEI